MQFHFHPYPSPQHRTSIPSPPVPAKTVPALVRTAVMALATTTAVTSLSANGLTTDNRIQSVSVKSQLTSFDSLETIFCCCRCTTKFKENYIPAWMPHRTILFHLRGSPTTFCFHLHGNPVTLASIHAKFPWSAFPCRSLVGTDWLRHQLNWVVLRARQLSVFLRFRYTSHSTGHQAVHSSFCPTIVIQ